MSEIICDVVAKNQVLYSGSLYSVMVPGSEGELGIMANHEPFVSALKDGVIWARTKQEGGTTLSAAIMGGYVQVLGERVIVLCDKTQELSTASMLISSTRRSRALEERIANLSEESVISRSVLTRKLRWCKVQLAAERKRGSVRLIWFSNSYQLKRLFPFRGEPFSFVAGGKRPVSLSP